MDEAYPVNSIAHLNYDSYYQHTLQDSFRCEGRGLHYDQYVVMHVMPAAPDTGYIFIRQDVPKQYQRVIANWANVADTRLSTTIINKFGVRVSSIEHLLAALYASGITNAVIKLNGPEVPVMDGSALCFVDKIRQIGSLTQSKERSALIIKQATKLTAFEATAELLPSPVARASVQINLDSSVIESQELSLPITKQTFESELSAARTFGSLEQISSLHKHGLARGCSYRNTILIDKNYTINNEGLRFKDEFARHQIMDWISASALMGFYVMGSFRGTQNCTQTNLVLISKLMSQTDNWEYSTMRGAYKYWRTMYEWN